MENTVGIFATLPDLMASEQWLDTVTGGLATGGIVFYDDAKLDERSLAALTQAVLNGLQPIPSATTPMSQRAQQFAEILRCVASQHLKTVVLGPGLQPNATLGAALELLAEARRSKPQLLAA